MDEFASAIRITTIGLSALLHLQGQQIIVFIGMKIKEENFFFCLLKYSSYICSEKIK